MPVIPSFFLFSPFQKGFVRAHTRKGKTVGPYFTKRRPGTVKEKHTKERFHDHSGASAKKAHEELEEKKKAHQSVLDAVKTHHGELTKKGPSEDEKGLSHGEKLSHLKAEIKNQETHIDNHSRKQDLIKNRYKISKKQIIRKKSKADLEKRIKGHTDEQKKVIRDIHKAHQEGKSNLEPGKTFKGKDDDHIYLETKHKDTGETHHVAINKDGSVKDPQILHEGKFDEKDLTEHAGQKKVVAKKEVDISAKPDFKEMVKDAAKWKGAAMKADVMHGEDKRARLKHSNQTTKGDLDKYLMNKYGVDPSTARSVSNELTREDIPADKSANVEDYKGEQWADNALTKKLTEKEKPSKKVIVKKEEPKKTEQEKKETRSRAMIGNKNAYKGGPKDEEITKTLKSELKTDPVLKGMGVTTDLLDKGKSELMDMEVKTPKEMAAIAQVFRDPRYETIRYVLTKNNKVVAHLAVTSKMPAVALVSPGKQGENKPIDWLSGKMKDHEADGYYLIHNHPSGDPEPSDQDIQITDNLNKGVKGYKGHIIINSGKYASLDIDRSGEVMKEIRDLDGKHDEILKPSLEHPSLGKLINSPDTLAAISKDFQNTDKYFTLIGANNKLKTRTILEVPMEMSKNTPEARKAFESFLRKHTLDTGANRFFVAGMPNNDESKKFLANAEHHKLILDASFSDNKILSDMQMETGKLVDRDKESFSDLPKQQLTGYLTEEKRKPKKVVMKTDAEETKNRSEAMKGNKNAWKGGPKEEPKKIVVKKQDIAAFTKTKKELDKAQEKLRTGKDTLVITARSKEKHPVRYKVVEADDERLIASNHIDGRINKDYPQLGVKGALQMRDRTNIQSKAQVTQMSNDLEPMFLTDSKIASDGAPIVGTDYEGKEGAHVVESGNGRVMAIRTAYENGKADHYKKHLVEEAETFGIDPGTIKGMKNPILIRERVDKMEDQEKAKFAKEANKATISQMTAVEQASEDSNYLGDLTNLQATESGRITNKNNSQFIKDFFSQVMDNDPREIGKLLNRDGQLNDEGERRLTNAVFVRVYGADSDIMNKLIMKDTDQTKKITAGMLAAAPRMAKFKNTLAKNDRHDLDISGNFIDALTAMEDLKRSGVSLEEKLQTVDWAELGVSEDFKDPLKNKDIVDIIRLIQEHGTGLTGSGKKVASLLTNYADEAEKAVFAEDPSRITIDEAMGVSKEDQIKTTKADILSQAKDEVTFMKADRKGKKTNYESYLEKYPTGKFATEAIEKLKTLEKPPEPGEAQVGF